MTIPSSDSTEVSGKRLAALMLGAAGVVYGDIGTSPLYAIQSVFGEHGINATPDNVLGALSLVFWALIIVVSLKYILFVMCADNKGEGGIMSLMALAQRGVKGSPRMRMMLLTLGLFGAALFYGDGVITPAISVLSAVEGVEVAAPHLAEFVVPITVAIILVLFAAQKHGTARLGAFFGPIMVVWFVVIGLLGAASIVQHPQVLFALSPHYAVLFFIHNHTDAFLALGAVVLVLTGAEALYADMGHFGKKPIRRAWSILVLPALLMNYFGQGALLIRDPSTATNPFYLMVPAILLYPMIVLATVATVIASQAVISGAYSMTSEAMLLGYSPRMQVQHTSSEHRGQIYLPWINTMLMIMVLIAVLGFRTDSALAAAYGIAVTGTMACTTVLLLVVARKLWHWPLLILAPLGAGLLIIDLAFFSANLIKVEYGGWFPLLLGLLVFVVMSTWRRGRELVLREMKQGGLSLETFIASIANHPPLRVPGTAIFLTANQDSVPHALLHNLKHNKVLHERNVLLTVETLDTPTADAGERVELTALGREFYRLVMRFGFSEEPDVPRTLLQCQKLGLPFDMMDTTFFLSRENIVASERAGMALWRDKLFAFLSRNAMPATAFFRIPGNRLVELGTQVEI
ncbi:potassium transporter Kup [Metallibacterium scheffleri]|uniref:potassium transporter Kup n=1 Tax=Metallibacterium scheffleri TaxID=993689 RepID=UPI0023F41B8A|nr:potassium transporter Kup [Metallibacterium scheffleri]